MAWAECDATPSAHSAHSAPWGVRSSPSGKTDWEPVPGFRPALSPEPPASNLTLPLIPYQRIVRVRVRVRGVAGGQT